MRDVGNVTMETDITFEFEARDSQDESKLKIYSLPFQIQIKFTRMDGTQCLRVITVPKKVTRGDIFNLKSALTFNRSKRS